jgi:hypothetical protein
MRVTIGMIRSIVRRSLHEARGDAGIPPEAKSIVAGLPGMKLERAGSSWRGTVRIGEKRSKEAAAFERAWQRTKNKLSKGQGARSGASTRAGWDGQTDTGGNSSGETATYEHAGMTFTFARSVSFSTGTKLWTLTVKQSSAGA